MAKTSKKTVARKVSATAKKRAPKKSQAPKKSKPAKKARPAAKDNKKSGVKQAVKRLAAGVWKVRCKTEGKTFSNLTYEEAITKETACLNLGHNAKAIGSQ
jgi:ribosomal protein L37AE/L43A